MGAFATLHRHATTKMAPDTIITVEPSYDLFLSYKSADHLLVEEIAEKPRDEHLEPFLDLGMMGHGSTRFSSGKDQALRGKFQYISLTNSGASIQDVSGSRRGTCTLWLHPGVGLVCAPAAPRRVQALFHL